MYKKEISFLADLNLNKLQALGDNFLISDIRKSNIHPAILQYIIAEIDKQILSDRLNITDNSMYDYSGDRIENYFTLIADEIKRTQIFGFKYIKQCLYDAINFNINFLVSPNKTLINSIFDTSDEKTIKEVMNGISHAYYYKYVQKILYTYLDKKKILTINRNEFKNLLERIDVVSKESHLEDILTTVVNSFANFFTSQSKKAEKIPIQPIRSYLEEKKLNEFANKLEAKFPESSSTQGSTVEILNVLLSVTPVSEVVFDEVKNIEDDFIEDKSDSDKVNPQEVDKKVSENKKSKIPKSSNSVKDLTNKDNGKGELKKKPDSNLVLDETIDLTPTYNSLIKEPEPFENITERIILDNVASDISEELEYQGDSSKLGEDLNISKETVNEQIANEDILTQNDVNLGETIDEVVHNKAIEKEFIEENNGIEEARIDSDEVQDFEDLISDEELELLEEEKSEITEVFKDLSFLDKEDESQYVQEPDIVVEERDEELKETSDELIPDEEESFKSFGDLVATKDMARIIESVFDYDMEDYHKIINSISDISSEKSAFNLLDAYCETNHIDLEAKEIIDFKNYISQYFVKVLS